MDIKGAVWHCAEQGKAAPAVVEVAGQGGCASCVVWWAGAGRGALPPNHNACLVGAWPACALGAKAPPLTAEISTSPPRNPVLVLLSVCTCCLYVALPQALLVATDEVRPPALITTSPVTCLPGLQEQRSKHVESRAFHAAPPCPVLVGPSVVVRKVASDGLQIQLSATFKVCLYSLFA